MAGDGDWPDGYEGHRRDQMRRAARETTASERVQWLEDTLSFLWRNGLLPVSSGCEPQTGDKEVSEPLA